MDNVRRLIKEDLGRLLPPERKNGRNMVAERPVQAGCSATTKMDKQLTQRSGKDLTVAEGKLFKRLEKWFKTAEEKLNKRLEKRFESAEEKLNKRLEKRFESAEEKLDKRLEKRFESAEEKLNKRLEKRFSSTEEKLIKYLERRLAVEEEKLMNDLAENIAVVEGGWSAKPSASPNAEAQSAPNLTAKVMSMSAVEMGEAHMPSHGEHLPSVVNFEGRSVVLDDIPESIRDMADIYGISFVLDLAVLCGGEYLYVPQLESLLRGSRNREIRSRFDGRNYKDLARQFRLCERFVRKIIDGTQ